MRLWRFSVEDLYNRLFLRYKIITEDPDRDLIRVPIIHCAFICRHFFKNRIEACSDVHGETKIVLYLEIFGNVQSFMLSISLYILQ